MKKLLSLLLPISIVIASCGTRNYASTTGWTNNNSEVKDFVLAGSYDDSYGDYEGEREDNGENQSRKIIYSAYLYLTVIKPDTVAKTIGNLAIENKGYISETGSNKAVIRVKSEFFESTLQRITELGEVTSKRVSGMDVSDEYLDYKIRLENAEKARTRYLELLDQAANVEEALLVEKELERLNGTIDLLKGKMNKLDHLEEFSTITVYLKEKKKPGIIGYIGVGIYKGVKWLFVRN